MGLQSKSCVVAELFSLLTSTSKIKLKICHKTITGGRKSVRLPQSMCEVSLITENLVPISVSIGLNGTVCLKPFPIHYSITYLLFEAIQSELRSEWLYYK
jgi:hypothetical protein